MSGVPVAVLGGGEIGGRVASALDEGKVRGAELGAVIVRSPRSGSSWPEVTLPEALERCDIVVECAGRDAVLEHGPETIRRSRTLLLTSVGALLEPGLRAALDRGPGRWVSTNGAIGGLDLLSAARRHQGFKSVALRTTKHPRALQQPWMDRDELELLRNSDTPRDLFSGDALEAGRRFPASLNVASALSVATDHEVEVTVRADPYTTRTQHDIHARHPLGDFRFTVANEPAERRPSTSAVVAYSVTRTLQLLINPSGAIL